MTEPEPGATRPMLYGRRRGRALRPGQQNLLKTSLPALRVALPDRGSFDPRNLFAERVEAVWLELGFGGGEHLAAQAAAHPEIGMVGSEVFATGIAKLLAEIERAGIGNIRLYDNDARLLVAALTERCLARVFILFPDPWPKERHKKRRIVSPALLDGLARAMEDGAELRLATDDMDYARSMLERGLAHKDFVWRADSARDWRERTRDWPATRYERKAIAAGRAPLFFRFARRLRSP